MSWQLKRLGDIAEIERNGIEAAAIKSGSNYVGLENINRNGAFVNLGQVEGGELASTKFVFGPQHILYGKLRPYLSKIARPAFIGICSTDILPIMPGASVDRNYLYHFLRLPSMVELATTRSSGANLPRISPKALTAFEVPLPTLSEQRRIAAILDQADALREKRRQAIAKLDTLVQAVFIDMFGDPVMNPKEWDVVKLGDLGTLDRGVSKHRPRDAPHLFGQSYPFVQTGDVANSDGYIRHYKQQYSEAGLKQSKLWPKGTLCITIAANIAKAGILTFDACFPDSVVGFTPNNSETEFIRVWLSFVQKRLEDFAPESTQKNINLKILRDLAILNPPLSLQQRFADQIAQLEVVRARMELSRNALDALFASVQSRAFSDRLSLGTTDSALSITV